MHNVGGKPLNLRRKKGKEIEKGRKEFRGLGVGVICFRGIDAPGCDDGDHGGDAVANGGDDDDNVDDADGETLILTVPT